VSIVSSKPNLSRDMLTSLDRLGLEDNIDTVYNISLDRLGLEDNIDTVYNPIYLEML
jgi:hypothetical protein